MRTSTLPTATRSRISSDLLRRTKAVINSTVREGGEALFEGLVVLQGEHRGRREHGDLLVVAQRFKSRAHGDFRFAVADVAAEQAIHGKLVSMSCLTSAMACA